jgi:hypothetical protein
MKSKNENLSNSKQIDWKSSRGQSLGDMDHLKFIANNKLKIMEGARLSSAPRLQDYL